jgi:hypothetical protein
MGDGAFAIKTVGARRTFWDNRLSELEKADFFKNNVDKHFTKAYKPQLGELLDFYRTKLFWLIL